MSSCRRPTRSSAMNSTRSRSCTSCAGRSRRQRRPHSSPPSAGIARHGGGALILLSPFPLKLKLMSAGGTTRLQSCHSRPPRRVRGSSVAPPSTEGSRNQSPSAAARWRDQRSLRRRPPRSISSTSRELALSRAPLKWSRFGASSRQPLPTPRSARSDPGGASRLSSSAPRCQIAP